MLIGMRKFMNTKGIVPLLIGFLLGMSSGAGIAHAVALPTPTSILAAAALFVGAFFLIATGIRHLKLPSPRSGRAMKRLPLPWAAQALIALAISVALGGAMGASAQETAPESVAPPASTSTETVAQPQSSAPSTESVASSAKESAPASGVLKSHYLDVGQGDSEFIELPDGKTMLIDAGEADEAQGVIDYISSLGYRRIDYVVATHPHADHIAGLPAVLAAFDIGEVWAPQVNHDTSTYNRLLDAVAAKGLSINAATAGKTISTTSDCTVNILSPAEGVSYDELNDWSVIIKITFGSQTFLYVGDAGSSVIASANPGHIDVLKVGHHGSTSSTNARVVAALTPTFAVISCGTDNPYGHPHARVLEALSSCTIYRTDINGTVVATCDGTGVSW